LAWQRKSQLVVPSDIKGLLKRCHDRIHRRGTPGDDITLDMVRILIAKCRDEEKPGDIPEFYCTPEEYASPEGRLLLAERVNQLFEEFRDANPLVFDRHESLAVGADQIAEVVSELQHYRLGSDDEYQWDVMGAVYEEYTDKGSRVFGWCSDRTMEKDRVHLSITSNTIEFMIEFREFLQRCINTHIQTSFLSYQPENLPELDSAIPTDLDKENYNDRIVSQLIDIVDKHVAKQVREQSWLPKLPNPEDPPKPNMWSGIFYGPPGSSKTFLAKGVAREVGRPLVVLSPSDFLARGEYVEARARDIFDALTRGTRMVYLLDEIDALILGREHQQPGQTRTVFSFLTPSFLTKLQDLHDAAEHNSFMFFIATNYFDRIDQAAKRRGRIDREFLILYPDQKSRFAIALEELNKQAELKEKLYKQENLSFEDHTKLLENVDIATKLANATELFSYKGLTNECSRIDSKSKPDLDFSVYKGRPGAIDEFIKVILLCPTRKPEEIGEKIDVFWKSIDKKDQRF